MHELIPGSPAITERNDGVLESDGFAILDDVVEPAAVDAALRHIHLELVRNGLSAQTIGDWLHRAHWFPHMKWDAPITALATALPEPLRRGEMCDPQILLHPPDTVGEIELTPHVDEEPAWADGRRYSHIVGVPLSRNDRRNGGLIVWPFGGGGPEPVELDPGQILVMHPRLPHTSGLNHTGSIRYAVYFRFLSAAEG